MVDTELQSTDRFVPGQDQRGDWWVWRRVTTRSMVTHRRCTSEAEAVSLSDRLNGDATGVLGVAGGNG